MLKKTMALLVQGFFILLPVLITYLMLGQLFDMLMALTTPIVDVLPSGIFPGELAHQITAAIVLVAIFVLVGLIAHTPPAQRFGEWMEQTLFSRFPPYVVIKKLSQRLSGRDTPDQLRPALLTVSPDTRVLVAVVEELPNGELTVFQPLAPTPAVGMLQIVSKSKVEMLDCSMADALGWILNWGLGTEAVLGGAKPGLEKESGSDARDDAGP